MRCKVCDLVLDQPKQNQKYCEPCKLAKKREDNRRNEERKRREAGIKAVSEPIACQRCGVTVQRGSGAARYCSPCKREVQKETHRAANQRYDASRPPRVRNPEEVKARQKRYHERHRERVRQRSAAYNAANREMINAKARARNRTDKRRAYVSAWERKKAATDPTFVLNRRMTMAVRLSLQGEKRGRRWETLVGYTAEELRAHLERQFTKGMSWSNMGEWHIDHILPKSGFNFTSAEDPDFRACWALTNLRPLWALENLSKHAKRLHLI